MFFIRKILLASLAAITASACAGEMVSESDLSPEDTLLPPEIVAESAEVGVAVQALGAPGSLNPLPARGGSGGTAFTLEGGMIYGIGLRAGDKVDQLQFAYYIPSQSDNLYRSGDQWGVQGPVGGGGGAWQGWYYCPGGYAVVGLHGGAGSRVDRLGLICGRISDTTQRVTTPALGGGGGSEFYDVCSSRGFMTGINGRSGRVIDRVQGTCRRAN